MMIGCSFTLGLLLFAIKLNTAEASITVREVPAGHLAELPCLSSDDLHRFMFWQLTDDRQAIGPGNPLDESKYNYEVLTGTLFIREVSAAESGFYKCVSRGIEDKSAINIHVVELIVKQDANFDNSFETNLLRGMAVIMVIVVGIAITLLVVTLKQKRAEHGFFDVLEEQAGEHSHEKRIGNLYSSTASPRAVLTPQQLEGFDNAAFDVDFPRVFHQMEKEQTM